MNREKFDKIREVEGDLMEYNYKGYKVKIARHPNLLHLCAYVTIPKTHKDYKEDSGYYNLSNHKFNITKQEWTFSRYTEEGFILGFDCAHYNQYIPGASIQNNESEYWTMEKCSEIMNSTIDGWE